MTDEFRLVGSSGNCCFGTADMFIPCAKNVNKALSAEIETLRPKPLTEEDRIENPWANPTHTSKHTYMRLREGTVLTQALQDFYAPGGMYLKFIEHANGWLVCFKAENILAARYMCLSKAEMDRLMSGIDLTISARENG